VGYIVPRQPRLPVQIMSQNKTNKPKSKQPVKLFSEQLERQGKTKKNDRLEETRRYTTLMWYPGMGLRTKTGQSLNIL
jgi:hypothetical protein